MKFSNLVLISVILGSCASGGNKQDPILLKKLESENSLKAEIRKADEELSATGLTEEKKNGILLNKAKAFIQLGSYKEALQTLTEILQTRSGIHTPHISYYAGLAYFYDKDYKKAISFFIRSDSEDPLFEPDSKRKILAKAYFQENQFGPGVAILGKASQDKNFVKDLEYYEMVSLGFYKMNLIQRSLPFAEEGLTKFPESKVLQEIKKDCLTYLESKKIKS
ncbi:MAG: hypothetical protein L6Q54_13165 [Leptospiraceae bacterium]|nr:tetratricopeptide repeat protein [Leptospiraceae bacterium]MCK6382184.1 hypothetical protein [Leptospiraceae bacterium]NUM42404.1 tetratricopeptide repeat protein [Leptospiraceae bacterium]